LSCSSSSRQQVKVSWLVFVFFLSFLMEKTTEDGRAHATQQKNITKEKHIVIA
jgi:hypothetical protein